MKQWLAKAGCLLFVFGSAAGASAEDTLTFSLDEVSGGVADSHAEPDSGGGRSEQHNIAATLDGLQWGMDKNAVFALLKRRIRDDFNQQVKNERDIVRQDALYQAAKQRYMRIREGFISFDGRKTGWDVSQLVDEFRHGSNEALLVVDDDLAREHYFFINDRLWKWYRELKPAAFDGAAADYGRLSARLRRDFGAAQPQQARRPEGGEPYTGLTFKDERTQATLLRRGSETCLVYEELATLERLALLRERALPRGPKQNAAVGLVLMTASEREAWRQEQDRKGSN